MRNRYALLVGILLLVPILVLSNQGLSALSLGSVTAESVDALAESWSTSSPTGAVDPPAEADVLEALQSTLQQIYEDVNPSVVNIQVVRGQGFQSPGLPEKHESPFEPSIPDGFPRLEGVGSGFIWDSQGHIVTNNHVVDGAESISVTFYDDTTVSAELVGTDPHSDLAVIKVDLPSASLQPVEVADSSEVRVGQLAMAIGNPFGLEGTMTVGFISALGRSLPVASGNIVAPTYTIPDIIQTDAPINPGNSGGVLVDDDGRVVGVPTAIESPVQANAGIGFAVPSAIVRKVVPVLISDGEFEHSWLGISGASLTSKLAASMELDSSQRGVVVVEVVDDSPASAAGLRGSQSDTDVSGGDVVIAIDDQQMRDFDDLVAYLARSTSVGQTVTLTLLRKGQEETVDVTLAARPRADRQLEPDEVVVSSGAWLGIRGQSITPAIASAIDVAVDQEGVLVEEVILNSPADAAGLLGGDAAVEVNGGSVLAGGDIIVAFEGQPVPQMEELQALLREAQPAQEVTLTLLREDVELLVQVVLGERPTALPF
jgi:S1-C subfamily serine protease